MKLTQVEIDRDETKYLLGEHVSTEKELYSQANEVVYKLGSSKDENKLLHSKLEQLRYVMNTNRKAVGTYAHETINSFDQMKREEVEAHAGNELLVDSLVHNIQKEKEIVTDLIEETVKPELEKFEKDQVRNQIKAENTIFDAIFTLLNGLGCLKWN